MFLYLNDKCKYKLAFPPYIYRVSLTVIPIILL